MSSPPLEDEWKAMLRPAWRLISVFTSVSSLNLYVRYVAKTGISPSEMASWSTADVATKTHLSISDASALKVALRMHAKSVADSARPTAYHPGAMLGDRIQISLGDLAEPIGQQRATNICDINFAERALVSVDEQGVDFSETILSSAGPKETIAVERNIHTLLTIPQAIIASTTLSQIQSAFESTGNTATGTFVAYNVIEMVSFFINSFAFMFSLVHISLCAFAELTDRSSAHYLTIPVGLRFLDLGIVFTIVTLLQPTSLVLQAYGVEFGGVNNAFFYVILSLSIVYVLCAAITLTVYPFREKNAYDPFPAHLNLDEPLYTAQADDNTSDAGDVKPESAARRAASAVRRFVSRFILFENDEKEVRYMGFIGRWRKFVLAKRFRESVLDSFGADCWREEELTLPPPPRMIYPNEYYQQYIPQPR